MRALIIALLLCGSSAARADNPFDQPLITPGVKVGWTFGQGLTYGIEVSVLLPTSADNTVILLHGPVLNLTWVRKHSTELRLGYQGITWGAGVEAGPALIWDDKGAHVGLGVTPFIGALVVPYYTFTLAGSASKSELGSYFKLPICTDCPEGDSGWGDGGDWD